MVRIATSPVPALPTATIAAPLPRAGADQAVDGFQKTAGFEIYMNQRFSCRGKEIARGAERLPQFKE
jgi:hypothetical protein